MRSYHTILVALDFSECSQGLIDQAISLADDVTRVVLVHVAQVPPGLSPRAPVHGEGGGAETAVDFVQRRSLERLGRFHQALTAAGVRAEMDLTEGEIGDAIVARGRHHGAELIVMGTHGRQGFARWLGGSVAAAVAARATCPVLTVRSLHKTTCRASSCEFCDSHLTTEVTQLMAERDG